MGSSTNAGLTSVDKMSTHTNAALSHHNGAFVPFEPTVGHSTLFDVYISSSAACTKAACAYVKNASTEKIHQSLAILFLPAVREFKDDAVVDIIDIIISINDGTPWSMKAKTNMDATDVYTDNQPSTETKLVGNTAGGDQFKSKEPVIINKTAAFLFSQLFLILTCHYLPLIFSQLNNLFIRSMNGGEEANTSYGRWKKRYYFVPQANHIYLLNLDLGTKEKSLIVNGHLSTFSLICVICLILCATGSGIVLNCWTQFINACTRRNKKCKQGNHKISIMLLQSKGDVNYGECSIFSSLLDFEQFSYMLMH